MNPGGKPRTSHRRPLRLVPAVQTAEQSELAVLPGDGYKTHTRDRNNGVDEVAEVFRRSI